MRLTLALFALTFLPGIPLAVFVRARPAHGVGWLAVAGTLGLVWSTATTLALAALGIPLSFLRTGMAALVPAALSVAFSPTRRRLWEQVRAFSLPPTTAFIAGMTIIGLAVPLLTVQRGLPTGDVQKAIDFAERILATHHLPDYQEALAFNRDPGDFTIPGLHALTAAVIDLSGEPLRGPAWLSLLAAVLLAGLAAALGATLLPTPSSPLPTTLAFLFAASNPRFLRYVQAPGYHYQNLLGELFLLLAFLFLLQSVGGRGGARFVLLAALVAATLPFVHQFTAFLALLLLPGVFVVLLLKYWREVLSVIGTLSVGKRATVGIVLLVGVSGALLALLRGPLLEKLPHLVTSAPHLRAFVISIRFFPQLLGIPFVLLGLLGGMIALVRVARRELEWRWLLVLLWVSALIALSQGARWVLDIPSARTLFYVVTPLSVFAALSAGAAVDRIRALWPRAAPVLIPVALALLLAPTVGASLNTSLQSIDHDLQANATLTPATLDLIAWLKGHPPACTPEKQNMASASENMSAAEEPFVPAGAVPVSSGRRPTERARFPEQSEGRAEEDAAAQQPALGAASGRLETGRRAGGPTLQHARHAEPRRSGECQDAILIDDWNRRRTTWTILSPYRMLTRVGPELAVIAREADQNDQRLQQYENLLDFEKIYALGNHPAIVDLLARHRIAFVVGVRGLSEDVFAQNPALEWVTANDEVVLYRRRNETEGEPQSDVELLDRDMLANDIGDAEDVFAHLPISLIAPQVSEPHEDRGVTTRDIQSGTSAIGINVGAYVPKRWDTDANHVVDGSVELILQAVGNGARGRVTRGTTVYASFNLPNDGEVYELRAPVPAGDLPIDAQGLAFITVRLDQGPLRLDLVAARFSTPEEAAPGYPESR